MAHRIPRADIDDKIIDLAFGIVVGGAILLGGAYLLRDCASETINYYRKTFDSQKIESIREDLNGNSLPERYIELGGKRCFLEIDGKPVQEYIKK